MMKTTVYLPEELDTRLEAESAATGVSKAELVRRGVAMLLETSSRPKQSRPLPVFNSGTPMSADAMDSAIHEHIHERATRR